MTDPMDEDRDDASDDRAERRVVQVEPMEEDWDEDNEAAAHELASMADDIIKLRRLAWQLAACTDLSSAALDVAADGWTLPEAQYGWRLDGHPLLSQMVIRMFDRVPHVGLLVAWQPAEGSDEELFRWRALIPSSPQQRYQRARLKQ